jgi:hypothetical protein
MIQKTYRLWVASLLTLCSASAAAQQKVEILPFGNMDQWVTREIKESALLAEIPKKYMRLALPKPLWVRSLMQIKVVHPGELLT